MTSTPTVSAAQPLKPRLDDPEHPLTITFADYDDLVAFLNWRQCALAEVQPTRLANELALSAVRRAAINHLSALPASTTG